MGDASIHRFYCLHFALPFVIFAVVIIHMMFLHEFGSSSPAGVPIKTDNLPFLPYYGFKDLLFVLLILGYFFFLIFVYPDIFGHPDNYMMASLFITPPHIVPE
jgi:ubiquinol-cytochrome c reductase cytochrome b subunit